MGAEVETVQDRFRKYCDQHEKLFIPDETRDPAIAKSLFKFHKQHYSLRLLDECIVDYIDNHDGPILIYDFAIVVGKIRGRLEAEKESREKFDQIAQETKKRMEQGF